ncbi:hypothetical protein ASPZODRAFT_32527, partial [Penicilliopsis zonata CBS 506.65]
LGRNLRNAVKKLNATAKVDTIIAENPGRSLDELVAENKINADQRAQALKKPALQATVAQLEEKIGHYKQVTAHYEERLTSQKTALDKAHKEEVEALREKVLAEAAETSKNRFTEQLLTLSKFLCAAASVRRSGDETSTDTRAFEGVLFQVYGGTQEAVASMLKLIDGADEKVVSVEGETLEVTFAKVKQLSESGTEGTTAASEQAAQAQVTDCTVANAGLTELQDSALTAGAVVATQSEAAPPAQTLVSDAANPLAESAWEPTASSPSANADGWVEVPRDPAETETGLQATPAQIETGLKSDLPATQPTGAWAEEPVASPKQGTDGFEPVVHHQRQNSGRGRGRGRGRGDGSRGRGPRGDFRGRGRGRGEFRGGNRGRGG